MFPKKTSPMAVCFVSAPKVVGVSCCVLCKYCTGAKAVGKCKAHKKHPGVYKCAPLCGKKCTHAKLEAAKKAKAAHHK